MTPSNGSDFEQRSHGVTIRVVAGDTSVELYVGDGAERESLIFDEAMDVRDVLDQAIKVACENIAPDELGPGCECGAPEPCIAPRFGGQHVAPEVWR